MSRVHVFIELMASEQDSWCDTHSTECAHTVTADYMRLARA